MYLQNIVCVAPVLHSKIVRTNIVIKTQTNEHTGWKHYHLANAGDNKKYYAYTFAWNALKYYFFVEI